MINLLRNRLIKSTEISILKTDFRLNRVFVTFEEAEKAVEKSIYNYNHLRQHMSFGYLTPVMPHQNEHPLKKH